ncbi:MAG: hypothetical protein HYW91_00015 [Candidatus Sungbacteria bacterium]|nr:hypothetical protein [Candidatus Sungbacteria bacterium]
MARSILPKSIRKFLRKGKSRLRREVLDSVEAEARIKELVSKIWEEYSKKEKA